MNELDKLVSSERQQLVAAEVAEDGGVAELFFRQGSEITVEKTALQLCLLLTDITDLAEFDGEYQVVELNGAGELKYKVVFTSAEAYLAAVDYLKKRAKTTATGGKLLFGDFTNQILMNQNLRLFRSMQFNDLRRLQFDLETLCSNNHEFPNAYRPADEIIIIAVSDNHGFEQILRQDELGGERELLEAFVKVVQERDPDVLEGHNIFRFDLPYLEVRAKRHKVKLALGRGGRVGKKRNSFFAAAERTVNYSRYDFYGRHVVDTMHLAQFYDIIHRSLESFNLKYLARHFGFAAADREYVPGASITQVWHDDRERLCRYALDDVRECRMLADKLLPSYFYMTQLVPVKLQDMVVRGRATIIDYMLQSAYLQAGQALTFPEQAASFAGALTVSEQTGVFEDVFHCDVRSLYPSIILANQWQPKRDTLNEFLRLLTGLREFRLVAKDAQKQADNPADKSYYNALQTTFKILINSFYGYLGAAQATFNDYALAEKITAEGRRILKSMLDFLAKEKCTILEADTDGVYFVRPDRQRGAAEWQAAVQAVLPAGITVELDSHYPAMFCYKSKNYALLSDSGVVDISGAGLKSRGLEPFQRQFMQTLVQGLLTKKYHDINQCYITLADQLTHGTLPTAELAKSENLKDSLAVYKKKMSSGSGRRSAAYELAIQAGGDYQAGEPVTYYVIGSKKTVAVVESSKLLSNAPDVENPTAERDYNRLYYLKKLDELYAKFAEFLPENIRLRLHGNGEWQRPEADLFGN